jgi:hypothetical protein
MQDIIEENIYSVNTARTMLFWVVETEDKRVWVVETEQI